MKVFNSPFSFKGLFAGLLMWFISSWIVMFLFPQPTDSSNSFAQDFSDVGAILAIILGILTYRYYQKKEKNKLTGNAQSQKTQEKVNE